MRCEYRGFELDCVWYPAQTMGPRKLAAFVSEVDNINAGRGQRLTYGFFAPDAGTAWRREFLLKTFWCLIRRGGAACGFAYNVDLGDLDGQRVVHAGLIRFGRPLGPEMVAAAYLPLSLGNLLNFGPHVATSITHLPFIAELFGRFAHDVFPCHGDGPHLGDKYQGVLHRLIAAYILPVLRYRREAVCERTHRIVDSLAASEEGFDTRWSRIGRCRDPAYKAFFEQSLKFRQDETGELHVCDDLIQIGKISYCFPRDQRISDQLEGLELQQVRGHPNDVSPSRVPSSLSDKQRAILAQFFERKRFPPK